MDIKQLARSLGIMQQPAIGRANELLRLLKLKVPGSLGQGEICRPAVCLELACQTTPGSKLPIRDEFIRYSCSAPKVYNEMFTRIQRLLDVRPALELRELVTIFGCSQLHDSVQQLMRVYKSRFLESLIAADRERADLSRPAFLAAAFMLTAKKHRARVDRAALTAKMGLSRTELTTAMEDIAARCADELGAVGSRKRERDDDDGGQAVAEGGHESGDQPGPRGAAGDGDGGRAARKGAKRTAKRAATRYEDDDGDDDGNGAAVDVAVEDFKLVLIGLGPQVGHPGTGGAAATAAGTEKKLKQRKGPALKQRAVRDRDGEAQDGAEGSDGAGGAEADATGRGSDGNLRHDGTAAKLTRGRARVAGGGAPAHGPGAEGWERERDGSGGTVAEGRTGVGLAGGTAKRARK